MLTATWGTRVVGHAPFQPFSVFATVARQLSTYGCSVPSIGVLLVGLQNQITAEWRVPEKYGVLYAHLYHLFQIGDKNN